MQPNDLEIAANLALEHSLPVSALTPICSPWSNITTSRMRFGDKSRRRVSSIKSV